MKRFTISAFFAGLLAIGWMLGYDASARAAQGGAAQMSGQGKMRFRVLYTSSHLPAEAQKVLTSAHGGFAVDLRPGKGETYFSLKGAGIVQISPDLKSTRMLETPAAMKNTNMHNAAIWYAPDGSAYLNFPGNEAREVYTTNLNGELVHTLKAPVGGTDLGQPAATDYFTGRGNFVPTDVEQLDGLLYVATGYSNLDFVLTARILGTNPFKAVWHDLAFGGKGTGAGQFGTGHGITVPPGTKRLDVADRPNSEIDRFTRYGHYLSTLKMPLGSFPCDIYYLGNYAVVGSLHGPDRGKGAPIYILENDQLISTVMPKEDLGLKNFQHIHNAVLREYNNKLYIIAQAWNPGDFAILEQVSN
ncbi:MAG: hypothetical protein WD696_04865 [Bryobacteraceae bacterium]